MINETDLRCPIPDVSCVLLKHAPYFKLRFSRRD
jgi:hypothetical protein